MHTIGQTYHKTTFRKQMGVKDHISEVYFTGWEKQQSYLLTVNPFIEALKGITDINIPVSVCKDT